MADVLTPEQRRLNMSHIRGRDTKPEMLLRRGLHARGLRFRLHRKDLPGCPDLVFPCFQFWRRKIDHNVKRDQTVQMKLMQNQWRVLTVWECSLRGPGRLPLSDVLDVIVQWLHLSEPVGVLKGRLT
jgi:DNA mismatch endonuclease (patch repair protein)